MKNKKHCNICNKDVSSTNWSKHLKTKIHKNLLVTQKNCINIIQYRTKLSRINVICLLVYNFFVCENFKKVPMANINWNISTTK
jgi:hypothetical protein